MSGESEERMQALAERLAPFDKFRADPDIDEIAVNHLGELTLWKSGRWETVTVPEITFEFLESVGANLANYATKPFDRENTSLSAYFPTGERLEMTHPPTAPEGMFYLNLRKHAGTAYPHAALIEQGYYAHVRHHSSMKMTAEERELYAKHLTPEEQELWNLAKEDKWAHFMQRSVELYQNIVVSGATGSGKTSYCRSLIEMISHDDRIITVEDTPEMPLPNHRNNNQLLYKKDAHSKEGATAKDVLHSVMRKTPKRVLLAELRGDETMYYLSGVLSSGHPGGITTTHANSPPDAFFRLGLLILTSDAGKSLDMQTIQMLLKMTVHVVVQLKFDEETDKRFVSGIYYDPMHRLSLLG